MHCRFQCSVVHFNSWSVLYDTCMTLVWPHTKHFVVFVAVNYFTLHCLTLLLCISVPKNSLHAQCISTPCFDQLPHPLNALCVTYSNSSSPGLPKKVSQMHPNAIQCSVLWVKIQLSEINALYSLVVLLSTRFTPPPHVFRLSSSEAAVWYGQKYGPYYGKPPLMFPALTKISVNQCAITDQSKKIIIQVCYAAPWSKSVSYHLRICSCLSVHAFNSPAFKKHCLLVDVWFDLVVVRHITSTGR